jgi:hypothetical protein
MPALVHLSLKPNLDGLPEDLQLHDPLPQPAALAILRAVGGWLYLPQLVRGNDISAMKNVIIQLREPAPAPAASQPTTDKT